MNFDSKTVFAFILIGLILILVQTPFYQKAFFPEAYRERQLQKTAETLKDTAADKSPQDGTVSPQEGRTGGQREGETQPGAVPVQSSPGEEIQPVEESRSFIRPLQVEGEREREINIETDLVLATLNTRGAVVEQWILKEYPGPGGRPVHLLPQDSEGALSVGFITPEGDTLDTSDWLFSSASGTKVEVSDQATVRFQADLPTGGRLVKEYRFTTGTYHVNLSVTLENMQSIVSEKLFFISANSGLASTEQRLRDDMYYAKAAISASADVNKGYKANGNVYRETGDIDWIGVRTKYFALVLAPMDQKGAYGRIFGEEIPVSADGKEKWKHYRIRLAMPYLGKRTEKNQFLVFLGPLDTGVVKSYGLGISKFMDFGWKIIEPFSRAVLWSFKKLHSIIPNYGLVIIIFSILIKIIVYPLTHKSFESMKKMQALQPEMAKLREQYAKDPQRLNRETMKLYKKSGVNPMGSCLPMMLQMPLLYALFIVFRSTIELRGQGFIWWIKDLSQPDTIATLPFSIPFYGDSVNILPLFMGTTMLLQQKMSVTDPKQKFMIYFMPIFFTLLFNSFPSGLNLYYALFNLLSILQQKYMVRSPGMKKS